MGYRIDYKPVNKIRNLPQRHSRQLALTGMFFLLFLVLLARYAPDTVNLLREYLIPGENAVTVAAVEELCHNLGQGENFFSAMEVFCRHIGTGAAP